MIKFIQKFDQNIVNLFKKYNIIFARFAIFIVYFWFGMLKIIGLSPATPLVKTLFDATINFMPFSLFYLLFSLFEVAVGIFFLIRGLERLAILMLAFHLITTVLPLFFLPNITWQAFLTPTLEGQYIIKNILIAACAMVVGANLIPISNK